MVRMVPIALAAAALAAVASTDASADPLFKGFKFGEKTISGTFTVLPSNAQYIATLLLDVADYRNGTSHKVFIKPEDYKLDKGGFTGQVNCPAIAGAGVKVVSAGSAPVLSCTWKVGSGGNAPTGDFTMD